MTVQDKTKTGQAGEMQGGNDSKDTKQPENTPEQGEKKQEAKTDEKKAEVKELEEHNAKLNKENEARRKENKELKEKSDRLQRAWDVAMGKDKEVPDAAALLAKQTDNRIRRSELKAAFVSVAAAEMHDAEFAFGAVESSLGEIKVDLEAGLVDRDALKEKLGELKKTRPFLFRDTKSTTTDTTKKDVKNPPDNSGNANGGDNPYRQWKQLQDTGRVKEAQEYYLKNSKEIFAHMGK